VWRLAAEPGPLLGTVGRALDREVVWEPTIARLLDVGGHARLLPLLRAALDDRWARVDAARALWRLGGDAGDLVEPLVAAAAECYGGGEVAVDLLVAMRATAALPRLRALAEQDARVVTSDITTTSSGTTSGCRRASGRPSASSRGDGRGGVRRGPQRWSTSALGRPARTA
jgi:hypothetical protein